MLASENLSIKEYVEWVNQTSNLHHDSISELGGGAAYCKLFDVMYPGSIDMENAIMEVKLNQAGSSNNLNLLQDALKSQGFEYRIDVEKLTQGSCDSNLEFIQWFHSKFSFRIKASTYYKISKEVYEKENTEITEAEDNLNREKEKLERLTAEENKLKQQQSAANDLLVIQEEKTELAEQHIEDAVNAAGEIEEAVDELFKKFNDKKEKDREEELQLLQQIRKEMKVVKTDMHGKDCNTFEDPLLDSIDKMFKKTVSAMTSIHSTSKMEGDLSQKIERTKTEYEEAVETENTQKERAQKAKRLLKYKTDKVEGARSAVKSCKYALALLDVYDNADERTQVTLSQDILQTLRDIKLIIKQVEIK